MVLAGRRPTKFGVTFQPLRAFFGDDVEDTGLRLAIFGVESAGDNFQLANGG
jgi:hypothetical protein